MEKDLRVLQEKFECDPKVESKFMALLSSYSGLVRPDLLFTK
jgi:hypothetical protein